MTLQRDGSSDGLVEFKEDQSGSEVAPMILNALKWTRTIQRSRNTIVPRFILSKVCLPTSTAFYLATERTGRASTSSSPSAHDCWHARPKYRFLRVSEGDVSPNDLTNQREKKDVCDPQDLPVHEGWRRRRHIRLQAAARE